MSQSYFLSAFGYHLTHLPFHPPVQDRLPQFPTIPQLECGYFALCDVPVQRVWADSQILGSLPHVHHFTRFAHEERHPVCKTLFLLSVAAPFTPNRNSPQVQPVVPLCHPAHLTVKPFSPAVVLRMPGILGNSPGIVGSSLYILRPAADGTTITCAFSEIRSLSHSTVIVCLHPPRSFLFGTVRHRQFFIARLHGIFLGSQHTLSFSAKSLH